MVAPIESYVAERMSLQVPAGSIDRERNLVKGIRVVGLNSPSHQRRYPLPVLEKHLDMYAAAVAVGHHFDPVNRLPVDVPPEHKFGRVLNPRISGDRTGITGDLKYNPEHAFAKPFLWAAENDPAQFSFSPLKRVRWQPQRDADGYLVAESILQVLSVDVVSDGGTTSTIYESSHILAPGWTAEMAAPDAQKIADSLETDGAWVAFFTDLATKMKGLAQTTKDAIMSLMSSVMAGSTDAAVPAEGADATAAVPAMESLRRMGPVGKWAAKQLDAMFVAESAKKRAEWAAALIKSEQLPESLSSPVFVSTVAESFGNEGRAKELIADRKKLGGPIKRDPRTSDRKDAPSVSQLVDDYVAG